MSHHVYATLNAGEPVRIGLSTESGSCFEYCRVEPAMGGAYANAIIRAFRDGVDFGFDAVQDDVGFIRCAPDIMFHVEGQIVSESQFFIDLEDRYLEIMAVDFDDPELGKREG